MIYHNFSIFGFYKRHYAQHFLLCRGENSSLHINVLFFAKVAKKIKLNDVCADIVCSARNGVCVPIGGASIDVLGCRFGQSAEETLA